MWMWQFAVETYLSTRIDTFADGVLYVLEWGRLFLHSPLGDEFYKKLFWYDLAYQTLKHYQWLHMQGIIALDIDGTLTSTHEAIPTQVISYLKKLSNSRWQIIFITGRPFAYCVRLFHELPFPYHVAPQNGAFIMEMPSQRILKKRTLSRDIIPTLERLCETEPTDFAIYSGPEHQDHVFYRPKHFSAPLLLHLQTRAQAFQEPWIATDSFDTLDLPSFPSVKCFGNKEKITQLAKQMQSQLPVHVPIIRDSFDAQIFIAQATHSTACKGQALRDFSILQGDPKTPTTTPTIAAGDDLNDISLLEAATISIAMANAPAELQKKADIIAPPATEQGIIEGLEHALKKHQNHDKT